MTPALLLFAVGGLLLVTGLLGGGFEMRELRIPQVGRVARVLATTAGALCILLGLGMNSVADEPHPGPGPISPGPTPTAPADPVQFKIRDSLGENQISEQATIIVDGRRVGDLTVTASYPEAELEVTVPAAGRHDYTVSVSSVEFGEDGLPVEIQGSGQGSMVVKQGSALQLSFADSGDRRDVTLMAE